MGRDLNGTELGKGIIQEKTGLYFFRERTQRKNICLRAKTMSDLARKIKRVKEEEKKNLEFLGEDDYDSIIYVYFITDGEFVKIGVTGNIEKRITTLQTGNPRRLRLLHSVKTSNPYLLEAELHEVFKYRKINSEWYDILDLFEERTDDQDVNNPGGC